jgi:hypothetical protein
MDICEWMLDGDGWQRNNHNVERNRDEFVAGADGRD